MFKEARDLHNQGEYDLNEAEKFYILETDIGEYGVYEGQDVPLDFPILAEKKDPPLNKPSLNSGSGKNIKFLCVTPRRAMLRKLHSVIKKVDFEATGTTQKQEPALQSVTSVPRRKIKLSLGIGLVGLINTLARMCLEGSGDE